MAPPPLKPGRQKKVPVTQDKKGRVSKQRITRETVKDTPISSPAKMGQSQNVNLTRAQHQAAYKIQRWFRRMRRDRRARNSSNYESISINNAAEEETLRALEIGTQTTCKGLASITAPASIKPPPEEKSSSSHGTRSNVRQEEGVVSQRVERIMNYLKAIELGVDCEHANESALKQQQSGETNSQRTIIYEAKAVIELKKTITGLQLECKEHEKTVQLLRAEMKRVRERADQEKTEQQTEYKTKLSIQRKEYEAIIKRHLTTIEKVLSEKEELSKKCLSLMDEYKMLEKKFKDKIQSLEESHERELKQKKDLWEAGEKLKRDRWIQERTKVIKDQTIKGLEPEIQRMVAQHKAHAKRMEEKYKDDMIRERELLMEQHRQEMESLRDRVAQERRKAAEEERELARQKYEKQLERDELDFQQQRRKLLASFEEQKDRLVASMKDEKRLSDLNWKKMLDDVKQQCEALKLEKQECISNIQRSQITEMARLKEQHEQDIAQLKVQMMATAEYDLQVKERAIKERLMKERDAEIEMVIQRLESETFSNSNDTHRRHRQEVERLRQEHAREIKQVQDQSNMALDRVMQLQESLQKSEEILKACQKELMKTQHECSAKSKTIQEQQLRLQRHSLDEDELKTIIKREVEAELMSKDNEIKSMRHRLDDHEHNVMELNTKHSEELESLKRVHSRELAMVESHVKQTCKAKEDIIHDLQMELEAQQTKVAHLQLLLDKQRKEMLSI